MKLKRLLTDGKSPESQLCVNELTVKGSTCGRVPWLSNRKVHSSSFQGK